ncbi:MAG: F0F1 ATP synthase subunit B' [Campylobacteraceae bacterium]|jgi:F-type H+-transporting ATPase subunit b|nr:F0F1 ATP synthase subunit B' [Campylobacteraceae bacterium]
MNMLDIDITLLCSTAVLFLVLLIVLNKVLYKPLLDFINNRESMIRNDLENAAQNADDVGIYHEEANQIILNAKNKAAAKRMEILTAARADAVKELEAKKSRLESEYNEFIKALESEKTELKNALRSQIPLFREALKAKLSKI